MTEAGVRVRGRSTRERRIADQAAVDRATSAGALPARARLPDLSVLTRLLSGSGELQALAARFQMAAAGRVGTELRHVTYAAMPHGAKSFLAAALAMGSGERLVWIARDSEIADRVAEELQSWLGDRALVVTLEPRTSLAYERSELIRDESAARVAALSAWRSGVPRVLVASVQALFQHTLAPAELPANPVELRPRQRMAQERVLRELIDLGYEALPEVAGRGEFARRGGIVDVFPAGQPLPVRIEWFGDEIESIRAFDPATQRGLRPAMRCACCRQASSCSARALAPVCAQAWAGPPSGCRPTWPPILPGSSRASWPTRPRSGPVSWRRPPASTTCRARSGSSTSRRTWTRRADFLWSQADERRAELERARVLPKTWPTAYPARREWKQRLNTARTLELTWESEADGAPPGGNPFGWHEPVPAAGRHRRPGRDGDALAHGKARGWCWHRTSRPDCRRSWTRRTSSPRRSSTCPRPLCPVAWR